MGDERDPGESSPAAGQVAIRASVSGTVQGVGFRDGVRRRAHELGVLGWVRNEDDGTVAVHAEGPAGAVEQFTGFLRTGAHVEVETAREEGHEQFAIRGVPAGAFVVIEHAASTHHFDLRLEVGAVMRSWALPRGPSLDPAAKRLAVQVADHAIEREPAEGARARGGALVWDRGAYEQGGRVPWPRALEQGHAVFVLHGSKLRGGFALQRTRDGATPQWLLVKRRDEHARPGSDVVAEQPASVRSGRTLEELLRAG